MTPRTATPELLDRLPPQDLEAEKGVLGSIILDRSVLDGLGLQPDDFYADAHRRLFYHLTNLPGQGQVDPIVLRDWIARSGDWEGIGGAAYISELAQSVGSIQHAGHYASIVRKFANRRRLSVLARELLQAADNGEDDPAAIVGEYVSRLESIGDTQQADRFPRMTCAELDSAALKIRYLVDGLLVAGQPGILAAPKKAMKTTISVDLGLSLATGTPFLGALEVTSPVRVALMSGESGLATIQETARRIANVKGLKLRDVDGLIFSDSLPQLGSAPDLAALRRFIRRDRLEVLILDPTYLMMTGDGAENLFKQGALLRPLTELGQATGCTILLVHHTRKNTPDPFQPPELESIAWSGFQEWARQWLLIGRREKYEPGSGQHPLWLNVGGSAGHSALWAVDIFEATPEHIGGRKWDVEVKRAAEARQDAQERLQEAKEATEARKLERDKERLYAALAKAREGETPTALRDRSGIHTRDFRRVLAAVLEEGGAVPCEVLKSGRTLQGYRLKETGDDCA